MGPSEVVDFLSQILLAAQIFNDFVQTGHDGVGLAQEIAVGHQLGHGDVSEKGELLLVFGMRLQETFNFEQSISVSINWGRKMVYR